MNQSFRPDTREEAAAKIPALHILMGMGWDYVSPVQCLELRGSERVVLLETSLRDHLAKHRFDWHGNQLPLSKTGIDQVVRSISTPPLQEGLTAANKKVHEQLTFGITVTEFLEGGQRTSVTVPLIDWQNPSANILQVTEELSVLRTNGVNHYRPDIVCYVNGIPLAVIEAKRPGSNNPNGDRVAEGVSQHIRNQLGDGIQDLYAYGPIASVCVWKPVGKYGTTETDAKFWTTWTEEQIDEEEVRRLKDWRMPEEQNQALFADRPWLGKHFEELWAKSRSSYRSRPAVGFAA